MSSPGIITEGLHNVQEGYEAGLMEGHVVFVLGCYNGIWP